MAADRLALAHAFEDAVVARGKAVLVATAVIDAIHDNVATKADLDRVEAKLGADIAEVKAKLDLVEHQMFTRLGGLAVVLCGLLFAALHYWPPGPNELAQQKPAAETAVPAK